MDRAVGIGLNSGSEAALGAVSQPVTVIAATGAWRALAYLTHNVTAPTSQDDDISARM